MEHLQVKDERECIKKMYRLICNKLYSEGIEAMCLKVSELEAAVLLKYDDLFNSQVQNKQIGLKSKTAQLA